MIAADLLRSGTMLCTPSRTVAPDVDEAVKILAAQHGKWDWSPKYDGVRVLAYLQDGTVMLRNRNGITMTARYPEVCAHLAQVFPTGEKVFDGEMLCFDPTTGRPEFARIARRDAQSTQSKIDALAKAMPASFMVFDYLWDGNDLRRTVLAARLALLRAEAQAWPDDPRLMLSQSTDDGLMLWDFVNRFGMEGVVAKDKAGLYRGGRDPSWIKAKRTHRLTAIVTGYENGKGARNGKVGALFLSLLNDAGELVPVGKVGSGLKAHDHDPMLEVLQAGLEFLVEVEYLEATPDGQLRFPVYLHVRSDLARADCTLSQIGVV